MAVLTTQTREHLDTSQFAIPETRSYPIHDEAHARNALARVSQFGSDEEKSRVRAAVHRKYPGIGNPDHEDPYNSGNRKPSVKKKHKGK